MKEIELDFYYYKYKGNTYQIVGLVKYKNPETRKWISAVAYQTYNDSNAQIWIREIREFIDRFKGFIP